MSAALGRGLQIGLPMAAIIVASVPVWGMSWHFDTENWAAGVWNSWAAQRTDTWRDAMVRAVVASGQTTPDGRGFMVTPPGVDRSACAHLKPMISSPGVSARIIHNSQNVKAAADTAVREKADGPTRCGSCTRPAHG